MVPLDTCSNLLITDHLGFISLFLGFKFGKELIHLTLLLKASVRVWFA